MTSSQRVAYRYLQGGSCPLRSRLYGGMPGGGGYSSNKEYEIGAQRIAEAAHCVLGSLGKGLADTERHSLWSIETGHLNEEMGIIEKCIKEYSRPLYLRSLNDPEGYGYYPQYIEEAKEWTSKMVASIRKASPSLASKAKKMMGELNRIEDIPEPVKEAARLTYILLIDLAAAMMKSVKNWDRTQMIGPNAFDDSRLRQSAQRLKSALSKLLSSYENF